MSQRIIDRDATEYVTLTVTESSGAEFDAATVEVKVGAGSWRPVEVVNATDGGVARVRFLLSPTASGLSAGGHSVAARLVDNPETVIVHAGRVHVR